MENEVYYNFCVRLHYARIAMNDEEIRNILDEIDNYFRSSKEHLM